MAVATLLILSPFAQSATVYFSENFSEGFKDQWVQSGNEKYSGRFVAESPEGLDDSALKVILRTRKKNIYLWWLRYHLFHLHSDLNQAILEFRYPILLGTTAFLHD